MHPNVILLSQKTELPTIFDCTNSPVLHSWHSSFSSGLTDGPRQWRWNIPQHWPSQATRSSPACWHTCRKNTQIETYVEVETFYWVIREKKNEIEVRRTRYFTGRKCESMSILTVLRFHEKLYMKAISSMHDGCWLCFKCIIFSIYTRHLLHVCPSWERDRSSVALPEVYSIFPINCGGFFERFCLYDVRVQG